MRLGKNDLKGDLEDRDRWQHAREGDLEDRLEITTLRLGKDDLEEQLAIAPGVAT